MREPLRTAEGLEYFATNRIPGGYTQYHTSRSDNITNGTHGDGSQLKFSVTNKNITFEMLDDYFMLGGRAVWEEASIADEISASLYAPATIGLTETAGDFDKVNIAGPYNLIKPVAAGTGAWDLDLEATLNANVMTLGACPVPNKDKTGWFDYDTENIVLTANMNQLGEYDLYDFDVQLHKFCNGCFGRATDGAETVLETADIIGKRLLRNWQLRFSLSTDSETTQLGIVMNICVRHNC